MKTRKHTRRALCMSFVSLLLCCSMLVGSTFAWFTDTATTNVNSIQAGKLDVMLEMKEDGKDWEDAEGKTLDFMKAAGAPAGETVLWEPGAEFKLPQLRIKNGGNLDLKFKVVVSGLTGDMMLADVLDVYVVKGTATKTKVGTLAQVMALNSQDIDGMIYGELAANATFDAASEAYEISLKMQESANNDYQDKQLSGLAITVYATQLASEFDSFDNTYDQTAPTLVMIGDTKYDTIQAAIDAAANGATIKLAGNFTLPNISNKNVTFTTTDADNKAVIMLGTTNATGSTITFDGVTVKGHTGSDTWYTNQLAHGVKAIYNNCTIIDLITTYCPSDFKNCVFENYSTAASDWYSVFVYGYDCTIEGCTFNTTASKAVKLYNEGTQKATLNVTDCTFNGTFFDKAAIEIDSANTEEYTVNITRCTTNEYYTKLWSDKSTKSKVTVDGKEVVRVAPANQTDLNDAISSSTAGQLVEVELPRGEYTLPTLTNKDVIISGDKDTVIDTTTSMPSTNNANVTFKGVTVEFKDGTNYQGFTHSKKVVFEDCVINGTMFLYSDSEFINCTFNADGNYNVWTYGSNATFTGCTFNTQGRAILVYNGGEVHATVTTTDCTFNATATYSSPKAAIEVGKSDDSNSPTRENTTYNIIINNCTADATHFFANNSTSNLWGNKNSMDNAHLNVVIDGVDVY